MTVLALVCESLDKQPEIVVSISVGLQRLDCVTDQ